jgi:hypothetical protein
LRGINDYLSRGYGNGLYQIHRRYVIVRTLLIGNGLNNKFFLYSCFWDHPREFNISNANHQLERETRGYFQNEFLSSQQTWVTLSMAKIESCKGSEMAWKAGLSIGIREVSNRELNNDKFLHGCASLNPIFGESPFVSYLRRKAAFRKLYFPTKNAYSKLP